MKYKIFVSANQKELKAERRAIKRFILEDTLLSEYFDVFLFEDAPAKSKSAEAVYLDEVKKSDIYIGILGQKYGISGKGRISPVEAEFKEAKRLHKTVLIHIKGENGKNDKKRDDGIQRLIKEISDSKRGFSRKRFNNNEELMRFVYASLIDIIKQAVIQQTHTPQFKRPFEIPIFAIQEAIVNAVTHRNYNVTSGVQVMVFADRIEVWNSGSLPPELSVEDLRKPHTSFPANPLLANALYLAEYIQKTGSGTLEMIKQCKAQGAPEPEFVLIRNVEFRTILPRDVFTETTLAGLELNERQRTAVKYVKEKGQITNKEYQGVNNVSKATASRELSRLVRLKVLTQQGIVGKGTFYKLS